MTLSKCVQLMIFLIFNVFPSDGSTTKSESVNLSHDDDIPPMLDSKSVLKRATQRLYNLNEYRNFYNDYLKHILRVRVPGTVGHQHVKNFIVSTLERFGWTVELDVFTMQTPVGIRKFSNIIATLHPKANRVLAIAAHYDSKDPHSMNLREGESFLGATDSAVPCAMMLDLAKYLAKLWKNEDDASSVVKVTPMLIFLDGEEAFKSWSDTDSLYGSRQLAKEFASRPHHDKALAAKGVTILDSLEAFILLDLIGTKTPPPQFWDLYSSTSEMYSHIQSVENKLKDTLVGREATYFPGKPEQEWQVEDDHDPFLIQGVPVLHLIPIPFPESWHKVEDNASSLDEDTIINLLRIFRQFIQEHLEMIN